MKSLIGRKEIHKIISFDLLSIQIFLIEYFNEFPSVKLIFYFIMHGIFRPNSDIIFSGVIGQKNNYFLIEYIVTNMHEFIHYQNGFNQLISDSKFLSF